jgi:hypothetical protein
MGAKHKRARPWAIKSGTLVPVKITFDSSSAGTTDIPGSTVTHVATGKYTVTLDLQCQAAQAAGEVAVIKDADSKASVAHIRAIAVTAGKPVITLQMQSAAGTDAQVASCVAAFSLFIRDTTQTV